MAGDWTLKAICVDLKLKSDEYAPQISTQSRMKSSQKNPEQHWFCNRKKETDIVVKKHQR